MTNTMIMKHIKSNILFFAIFAAAFTGCIEEYIPTQEETTPEFVVEGFIEAGEGSLPAYVLITQSIPFLSTVDLSTFNSLFVNDAIVSVSDGSKDVQLTELCLNDLPPAIKEIAAELLGVNADSTSLNICAYIDLNDELDRREGGQYDLSISIGDTELSATTTIPRFVPLYNFRWEDPPGVPSDTLARLFVTINDPADTLNFYRLFTEENDEGLVAPFQSVVNDAFYDGQEFEFPLSKAERRDAEVDPSAFGFFTRGDSIRIKWMTIDEAHFDFWTTLDFSRNSQGPFSSFNRVTSNVEGALGIWGGASIEFYEEVVPPN